ncbi:MAG: cytochrome b [Acetobacteraceae bacterium]|nr:cytochrome b [Acetobacteraceae bacterium]
MDSMTHQAPGRVAPGGAAYGTVAKWLHWITAGLMLVALPMGFAIQHVKDASKMPFYAIHESAGVTIFVVVLIRIVWKRISPPPPLDPAIPRPMRVAATAVHHALYAMLLIQPLLGFFMTNAFGFPMRGQTAYLFLIDFPKFMDAAPGLAEWLKTFHVIGGWTILVLLVLHIGAVVFHQAIRRDDTLLRMV